LNDSSDDMFAAAARFAAKNTCLHRNPLGLATMTFT
jgi:hypothetical protein